MKNENMIVIIDILKDAKGALYQKDLIKILDKDINERQVRRYLKRLEELKFLKVDKIENKYNILYLTTKAYKEILGIEKRTSNTWNNYILEKNFLVAYVKYKYKNVFQSDIFKDLYDKYNLYNQNKNKIKVLEKYKENVVMHNNYIYDHQEIQLLEEYITILHIVIYKHTIQIKDLKNIIVILNEIIERFVDIENNIVIDYKVYSFNIINIDLLERELAKYYNLKSNKSDIVDMYKIEVINPLKEDI